MGDREKHLFSYSPVFSLRANLLLDFAPRGKVLLLEMAPTFLNRVFISAANAEVTDGFCTLGKGRQVEERGLHSKESQVETQKLSGFLRGVSLGASTFSGGVC